MRSMLYGGIGNFKRVWGNLVIRMTSKEIKKLKRAIKYRDKVIEALRRQFIRVRAIQDQLDAGLNELSSEIEQIREAGK